MQIKNWLLLAILFLGTGLSAQVADVQFGKNRIQYHDRFDDWFQYESENFITYWYGDGQNIARTVVQMAEKDFNDILRTLNYPINFKVQIIVYNDLSDLKQSNLGSEEAFTNTEGHTKTSGDKVFVYFNGDHRHLHQQIREGVASVYLEAMLFGLNLQEIVQNAITMDLPLWFKGGLIKYIGNEWSVELDDELRNILQNEDYDHFDDVAEDYPYLAGQAFWYYLGEILGKDKISDVLYLTRINRDHEAGILSITGIPIQIMKHNWMKFFKERYAGEAKERKMPTTKALAIKVKASKKVTQALISPNGKKIAYVENEIGKYKVIVYDIKKDKSEVVFKKGYKNAFQHTDYGYPLISWNPNNQSLGIMYEYRDVLYFLDYNLKTGKQEVETVTPNLDRVYSMDYINPFKLVISAAFRGYSDIYIYHIKTRQAEKITQDFYDDLDAVYTNIRGRNGIVFRSNRPDTKIQSLRQDSILPLANMDLFYYNLDTKERELLRLTNTPYADEKQIMAIDTNWVAFTSDERGIFDRKIVGIEEYIHHYEQVLSMSDGTELVFNADSSISHIDTMLIDSIRIFPVMKERAFSHWNSTYPHNLAHQHNSVRTGKTLEVIPNGKESLFYVGKIAPNFRSTPLSLTQKHKPNEEETKEEVKIPLFQVPPHLLNKDERPIAPKEIPKAEDDLIDLDNYEFQEGFEEVTDEVVDAAPSVSDNPKMVATKTSPKSPFLSTHRFRPGIITPYRTRFHTAYTSSEMDNSLLFDGMESYNANSSGYNYQQLGLLMKMGISDLLEDYQLDLGVRIPTSFNGAEYFAVFKDKKKRLDKQYAVYRKTQKTYSIDDGSRQEYNILLGQYRLIYPLDIFRSFRGTFSLRRDRNVTLATERANINQDILRESRVAYKVEYVFDNAMEIRTNIKHGTQYKVYAEMVKSFNVDAQTGLKIGFNEGFMGVLGFDFRHFQKLDKYSIFAIRAAGATSFGAEKLLFYMGGIDHELFNTNLGDLEVPPAVNFSYQTAVANMRGFTRNVRNGNSYALANAELRVPILKYAFPNTSSSFINNFQLVAFADIGTAWAGSSPLSDDNPLNISYFPEDNPDPKVSIKVKYFRDPLIAGYGVGVRTMLLGHFIRFDYGYGVETGEVLLPRLHIGLGTDF